MKDELIKELAHYEIGWWKSHHRRDKIGLRNNMAKLYALQFNISYGNALKAVEFRVQATKEHDLAEEFEDQENQDEADKHWFNAESLLKKHFEILSSIKGK